MNIYQSYTYLVGWSQHNKWYYGVRFGNRCKPEEDLWIRYFTSSKYVKEFRKTHGEPDIIKIRKKFNNHKDATLWEEKVLKRLKVLSNNNWLNKNINGAIAPMLGVDHPRFGSVTSQDVKHKISCKNKGRTPWNKGIPRTKDTIDKIIKTIGSSRKGENNAMYGRTHTIESIKKMKNKSNNVGEKNPMYGRSHSEKTRMILSQKNSKENSNKFLGYYVTPWGVYPTANDAAGGCPAPMSGWTISRWCRKDNLKIISKGSVVKSQYLTIEHMGKTFKDLGFEFQPNMA